MHALVCLFSVRLRLVLLFLIIVPLASASAQTAWVSTSTKAVGPMLSGAALTGYLDDSTPLHIVVGLKTRNSAALAQFIQSVNDPASPLYETFLTPDQFAATYAPTSDQVQSVVTYLTANGFTNVQVEANQLLITADGAASAVGNAFGTLLGSYSLGGQTVYANVTDAQVPASLGGIVAGVLGLNNVARMAPPSRSQTPAATATPAVHFYRPNDFWVAYDVGGTPTGSRTKIAIFAEGDISGVITDLRIAEKVNGLPQVPLKIVQVGLASTDTAGAGEWDLDTQMSTGMAGTVSTLYMYVATSLSDSDIALTFNRFVTQNVARAGSASFGECEAVAFLDGAMVIDDMIFAQAAAQGQTIFASTGDQGSACPVSGATNGAPLSGVPATVLYPASSPYVVAVGGTTLTTDASFNYILEVGWDAGGGGVSVFEISPFWQQPIAPLATAGKGLPDISMDGDIVSGGLVYSGCIPGDDPNNCQFITGGTSMSSPLALGVWARLQSAHGNKLGFAAPLLYKGASGVPSPASPPGFHDVVGGCNGLYCAIPGYDYVTGLGTFDVAKINAAIKR